MKILHLSRNVERDRFIGSLVGTAVGDSLGELVLRACLGQLGSNMRPELVDGSFVETIVERIGRLRYTDDTAMAIGLAESILARSAVDPQYLGGRFHANFNREPWRGYADGPGMVFLTVETQNVPYTEAAWQVGNALYGPPGSFGNGASMRIAPLGLYYWDQADLYQHARDSAIPTHTHPIAIDGAAVLAKAVAKCVGLRTTDGFDHRSFLIELHDFARTLEMRSKIESIIELCRRGVAEQEAAFQLGQGVATHESVPFALYSFLKHPHSFEDCLFCAVTNGGDTDTVGAMACAISGAFLGQKAIPRRWKTRLENLDYLLKLANWLWARKSGSRVPRRRELRRCIETWDREIKEAAMEQLEELQPLD